jgi:membrane-bound metal-dependent hydrolase YbcI (DUF457 family)
MFIGHFAVGFASKRLAPRASLGILMIASLFLDLLWPIFLLLGLERVRIAGGPNPFRTLDFTSYPWSHSLLMTLVWSAALALLCYWRSRDRVAAWVIAALVTSHWVLDWVTHAPDMPIAPGGGPRVGLGLWNSPVATMVVEGLMYVAGLAIYLTTTRARNLRGAIGMWAFVLVLAALYVGNLTGPPPPSAQAIGTVGLVGWLFALWIWWFDRNREPALRRRADNRAAGDVPASPPA